MCMFEFVRGRVATRDSCKGVPRCATCGCRVLHGAFALQCKLLALCMREFVAAGLSPGCLSSPVWAWVGGQAQRAFGVPTPTCSGWVEGAAVMLFYFFAWPAVSQGHACVSGRAPGLCGLVMRVIHSNRATSSSRACSRK